MKVLGIDSSSLVATVAVVDEDILVAEYTVNFKKTHSQTLLPMIQEISNMIELDLNTIDVIAISEGPGSFTGLRIGSATAKGLGMALDKPLVEVPTLEAMAYNLIYTDKRICPIMDAKRNQVYTGIYRTSDSKLVEDLGQSAMDIAELVAMLEKEDTEVIFVGDGVPVYRAYIDEHMKLGHSYGLPHLNRQRAAAVATLGMQYAKEGKTIHSREHAPEYLRLSQAERELIEKTQGGATK